MADSKERDEAAVFDAERLRPLVALMKEHELNEIDWRQRGERIRIRRGVPAVFSEMPMPVRGVPRGATAGEVAGADSQTEAGAADSGTVVVIKSPMVGTFYQRPSPNTEPFVRVGDHISPDTTICIIEAMKVFNEIPADVSGRVIAVLVDNETPVDFGRPLFKIDTSG